MSGNSGVYKYNPDTKLVEKVSDQPRGLRTSVYWQDGCDHSGMYSESCNVRFRSKAHKREFLRRKKWAECG